MALRGPYALRLILRKFSGRNIYSGQRVLQIHIRTGGGAGTGVPISSTPTFNKAKVEALIPILEQANQIALDCVEKTGAPKGSPTDTSNLVVSLFWLFTAFFERTLFKAEIPVESGASKFQVDVIYNPKRNTVRCVITSVMFLGSTMPARMNCAQFKIFKDRVIQMAQDL